MGLQKYFLFLAVLLLVSCSENVQRDVEKGEVYHVDLNTKVNPFGKIFSNAEIIPLETANKGLIVLQGKIYVSNRKFYIFDLRADRLYVFGADGNFLTQVGKHGKGPGEYLNLYDCYVDTIRGEAFLMSVFGHVNVYDLDGRFKEKIVLPSRNNYYSVVPLDKNVLATWSGLDSDEDAILVLDRVSGDGSDSI